MKGLHEGTWLEHFWELPAHADSTLGLGEPAVSSSSGHQGPDLSGLAWLSLSLTTSTFLCSAEAGEDFSKEI